MAECFSYEVIREGEEVILRIDCEECPFFPSLEDDPKVMSKLFDTLLEAGRVTKIVFAQKRDFEYDYAQTQMLIEIAQLINQLVRQKVVAYYLRSDEQCTRFTSAYFADMQHLVYSTLKSDPISTYVHLKRLARDERIKIDRITDALHIKCEKRYLSLLAYIIRVLDKTRIISIAKPYLEGYKVGDRSIYRRVFRPTTKPDFMFTKLMASYPPDGEELDSYNVDGTEVTIFSTPDTIQYLYHIVPPEFKLSEEKYELIDIARNIMAEHKPKKSEFVDPQRMREVFSNVGHDLIEELAVNKGIKLRSKEFAELTKILVRYTVGFGLIEVLLQDEKVQDITINSPMGQIPMFIVHADYTDCRTNIMPTVPEAESWASKLRMISGRPLDEANPILDTDMTLPGASARVAVIAPPLNPSGLAYAFRRHRDKPWTLPLFIKNRMVTPLAAGLISFLIDGSRTILVAGTRSAGKTSVLGSVLTEILRKNRILTIEDSITGNSLIIVKDKNVFYRTTVEDYFMQASNKYGIKKNGSMEYINLLNTKISSCDRDGKISMQKTIKIHKHTVTKDVYEVITATGRVIEVTKDHSLFTIGDDELLNEIKTDQLIIGDKIAVPLTIQLPEKKMNSYQTPLSEEGIYVQVDKKLLNRKSLQPFGLKSNLQHWCRGGVIPLKIAKKLNLQYDKYKVNGHAKWMPVDIKLDQEFLEALGLWIADGCYDRNSIIFSVSSPQERLLVRKIAERFGFPVKNHSDKFSLMIHSASMKYLFEQMDLTGNAYTKKIPAWIFTLKKSLKSAFLRGFFSGDGCVSDKEIIVSLASLRLLDDLQTILLSLGITFRINRLRKAKSKPNDRTKDGRISDLKSIKIFAKTIRLLQPYKNRNLDKLADKISTHDTSDNFKLGIRILEKIKQYCPRSVFNSNDYINRNNALGRRKLKKIAAYIESKDTKLADYLKTIANADILWDKVVRIKKLPKKQREVYDFSVPGQENFVAGNILAHNTLELPAPALRKLGYNIQQMKVASAMTKGTAEVSADVGIRTTLRLGDSCLFVGEVRSTEAKALYEAMRVGALANVVAGTIHGDSPYGVYDRVVNDLGVPRTSFKATDIIIVANPIKSADGLHRWRRVTQITEVRKFWEKDPLREGGFVDLMKYDSPSDELKPSDDLINGDSDILKAIAGNVKEWAGNWDAVWDNVLLRAKVKERIVKAADAGGNPELLEAPFSIMCNDEFHRVSDKVREEVGALDSKMIYSKWNSWLTRKLKRL